MATIHIAPSFTAGVALHRALSAAGAECTILADLDDLSHGPIDAQSLRRHSSGRLFSHVTAREEHSRHIAWLPAYGRWDPRFIDLDTPTVFWFGRRSAEEMCSMLYFASAAEGRPWSFIDVTESNDHGHVAATSPSELELLIDSQVPVDDTLSAELAERWRILQHENAPFRVLTGSALTSVPEDYFDRLLLQHTPTLPTPMSRVIAETMGRAPSGPVADYVLRGRLIELIAEGKIAAEGNPSTMESCLLYRVGI
ncbi:DUF3658 domain-containing protein [Rhodococcus sp. NPDC060090]|uniref:DUF3658 domain-containing protein n=1 Tax=Rhodococcus sp. NPDC060090 TaxID=3347056 RepID=UPI003650CEE0